MIEVWPINRFRDVAVDEEEKLLHLHGAELIATRRRQRCQNQFFAIHTSFTPPVFVNDAREAGSPHFATRAD